MARRCPISLDHYTGDQIGRKNRSIQYFVTLGSLVLQRMETTRGRECLTDRTRHGSYRQTISELTETLVFGPFAETARGGGIA